MLPLIGRRVVHTCFLWYALCFCLYIVFALPWLQKPQQTSKTAISAPTKIRREPDMPPLLGAHWNDLSSLKIIQLLLGTYGNLIPGRVAWRTPIAAQLGQVGGTGLPSIWALSWALLWGQRHVLGPIPVWLWWAGILQASSATCLILYSVI